MTAVVRGIAVTQYIQNRVETTLWPSPGELAGIQSNMPVLKTEAIYVPGRKRAVMNVNAIMAILSFLVEEAIRLATRLSFCEVAL
jgi:hypothetical protein